MGQHPPASTSFQATPEALKLFESARNGAASSELKNNAALDKNGITAVVKKAFNASAQITTVSETAAPGIFWVCYTIAAIPKTIPGGIRLTIKALDSSTAAQTQLKADLSATTAALSLVAKKSEKPLGHVSLQRGQTLTWIRDALLIDVESNDKGQILEKAVEDAKKPAPKVDLSKIPKPPLPAIPAYIQTFAAALDKYLGENAVPAAKQRKPDTTLATKAPLKVAVHTDFNIKLAKIDGTHILKPSLAKNGVASIGNGTNDGYPFRALAPGVVEVTLIVAHAETLAVGTTKISVEVTGKADDGKDEPKDDLDKLHDQVAPWA